jgi:hypothetical protein
LVVVAAAVSILLIGTSAPATAAVVHPDSSYVVASMPLINETTGQSSYNYGYVQLWYDTATGDNWARMVFLVNTPVNFFRTRVTRADNGYGYQDSTGYSQSGSPATNHAGCANSVNPYVVCSWTTYSPNQTASAAGEIITPSADYQAATAAY